MIARPVYLKAIVGALLALATWGGTALADDHVTSREWFGLLGAVVTGAVVYVAKNGADVSASTSTPQPTTVSAPHPADEAIITEVIGRSNDRGAVPVLELVLIVLVIVVLLVLLGVL